MLCVSSSLTAQERVRIATYNTSLYGKVAGQIRDRLSDGIDSQAEKIAAIVQTVRPDILLVNEIDYDSEGKAASLLAEKFFAVAQTDPDGKQLEPIEYLHVYAAPSNTGIDSAMDLNNNDRLGEPNDAWGFGRYPGQYSMAVYSRFPIDQQAIRTFRKMLWSDLPNALRPTDPESGKSYYPNKVWKTLRLSSKNHIDVPISVGGQSIHVLASHPTPPVFDGPEDRNGCRNHDEIRFWIDYLAGEEAEHLVDDQGDRGGIDSAALLVVMGDLNADPSDGDGQRDAIKSLLSHNRLRDPAPKSQGGIDARADDKGDPSLDTARFRHGNMRIDYVLPSRNLNIVDQGVFWPRKSEKQSELISASDHRLVWIEVELP